MALSKKELKKTNLELVNLHRSVLENHLLVNTQMNSVNRSKVLRLYEAEVRPTNIRSFYNVNISLFLTAMLFGRLEDIKKYKYAS